MRRIMLLALLALAFPTAALANSISSTDATITIPFNCPAATDCRILTGHPNFTTIRQPFSLTLIGAAAGSGVVISGVQLSPNPCGPAMTTCMFTGGAIAVTQGGVTTDFPILSGDFTFGPGTRQATGFDADLGHGGSFSITTFSWNGNGHLETASGSVTVHEPTTVIPEPSTLGLLGTGLIGLAEITRRKRKYGT